MSSAETGVLFGVAVTAMIVVLYFARVMRSPDRDWRRDLGSLLATFGVLAVGLLLLAAPPPAASIGIPVLLGVVGLVLLTQAPTPRVRVVAWAAVVLAVALILLFVVRVTILGTV